MKSRGNLEEFGNMSSRIRWTTYTKNSPCVSACQILHNSVICRL